MIFVVAFNTAPLSTRYEFYILLILPILPILPILLKKINSILMNHTINSTFSLKIVQMFPDVSRNYKKNDQIFQKLRNEIKKTMKLKKLESKNNLCSYLSTGTTIQYNIFI